MNAMYHVAEWVNPHRARHWWIRLGTKDSDTSLTVAAGLVARLKNLGDDEDTGDFVTWIGEVTGRSVRCRRS
ncbi:hypothetical protein ACGF3G_38035 [Streptomyces sp. NPDC048179]|uniref:hypothetical protein n=1 Tax=Streptomyces sp. NPDC048179 TaxID=3365506 RepID=UPI003712CA32